MVIGGKGFDPKEDIEVDLVPDVPKISDLTPKLEDVGVNIVKGIEKTYDYLRTQMIGKEDKIVQAFTVGSLAVLAGLYMISRARRGELWVLQIHWKKLLIE